MFSELFSEMDIDYFSDINEVVTSLINDEEQVNLTNQSLINEESNETTQQVETQKDLKINDSKKDKNVPKSKRKKATSDKFKKNKYFKVFLKPERGSIVSLNNSAIDLVKEYFNELEVANEQTTNIPKPEKIVFFKKRLLKKGVKNRLKRSKSSTK